ncbi:LysR family transcriptional regulator [Eggerthella timonensis]|uniref:LysR family transcriptional regulator n=1 Tax=Eggerthella timonensis TaxID=1871008 RepID=UPI000C7852C6|nr:LysR family transcriptional regulator [Eggerthella timonensis]
MELQQLRYFDEVARTQHVTNSAKKLNVAQPALTQSIRRLERELGVPLFERVGRNVRLTACGEALEKRIAPLLAALDELPEELAVVAGRERAAVHLAIESASGMAVDAIAAYRASHPDARFVVAQETAARRWDVRLRTVRSDATTAGARRFTERIGIAVPSERAASGPIALADLEDEPFICLAGSRTFRAVCDEACAHAGFAPRVAFESDSPAVVKNMIGLGLGVGFWPERSWGGLEDGSASLAAIVDAPFARTIEIAPAQGPLNEEAAAFHGFLVSYFEKRWREPSPLRA